MRLVNGRRALEGEAVAWSGFGGGDAKGGVKGREGKGGEKEEARKREKEPGSGEESSCKPRGPVAAWGATR